MQPSVVSLKHLASRTADADIGNKLTQMEVMSDIFGVTVVFRTVTARLLVFM